MYNRLGIFRRFVHTIRMYTIVLCILYMPVHMYMYLVLTEPSFSCLEVPLADAERKKRHRPGAEKRRGKYLQSVQQKRLPRRRRRMRARMSSFGKADKDPNAEARAAYAAPRASHRAAAPPPRVPIWRGVCRACGRRLSPDGGRLVRAH